MSAIPFIKFYPSDWLSEESLRLVSPAARGLWIDMLCLMAKNDRRGYLEVNGGVNPSLIQLGRLVGMSAQEIEPLLEELKSAGTCSVDANGTLFSRRLVRDTDAYEKAVSYGKKGGNPKIKNKKQNGDRVNPPVKPNQQPSLGSGFWVLTYGFSDKFHEVWCDWIAYRREKKLKPLTQKGEEQLTKRLAEMGEYRATAAIQYSMAQNWQGIFEEKLSPVAAAQRTALSCSEPSNIRNAQ
jgi:hypothetical protein